MSSENEERNEQPSSKIGEEAKSDAESNKRKLPWSGGPWGVGDPEDKSLRRVEKDVLIPKLVRKLAHAQCKAETMAFNECGKNAGLRVAFDCRDALKAMEECVIPKAMSKQLYKQAKKQYLEERTRYRETGIGVGQTGQKPNMQRKESQMH